MRMKRRRALAPSAGGAANERRTRGLLGDSPQNIIARLLCDHTIPLATAASLCLVALSMVDAARGLSASHSQRQTMSALCSALAAEEAAFAAMRASGDSLSSISTSWGLTAGVERVRDLQERLEISVQSSSESVRFSCDCLRGAAPACFARPLTLGDRTGPDESRPTWLRGAATPVSGSLPQLTLPPSPRSTLPGLFCDSEVAFLYMPTGTDRTDYTIGGPTDRVLPTPGTLVVEVPGNLWMLPAPRPLRFVLRAPLTLVVRGNAYLARSIIVEGDYPLTIVAHRCAATFRDLDGNGARSDTEPVLGDGARPVEGDGSLYLGHPGPADVASLDALVFRCHLVAYGEIHLLATTHLDGALVGAHGLTRCSPHADLSLTGRLLLDVSRVRVPGFATSGGPRPGLLRREPKPVE